MKLYAINVFYKNNDQAKKLSGTSDLSSFGYFQRSSVQEIMDFTSKILAERTATGQRASVREQDKMEYVCHIYVRADNLVGIVISDHEYPIRVSFSLLNKVLDEFASKYSPNQWADAAKNALPLNQLGEFLKAYQNPKESDALTKIQADLDETLIILLNSLEALLEREESLDNLMNKTGELSLQSKLFYNTAKKTNSCCTIL